MKNNIFFLQNIYPLPLVVPLPKDLLVPPPRVIPYGRSFLGLPGPRLILSGLPPGSGNFWYRKGSGNASSGVTIMECTVSYKYMKFINYSNYIIYRNNIFFYLDTNGYQEKELDPAIDLNLLVKQEFL